MNMARYPRRMRAFAILFILVASSCERSEPLPRAPVEAPVPAAKAPPAPPPPTTPSTPPAPPGCEVLDRTECLASTDCTLHRIASNHYECRAAIGSCEIGLVQEDKQACEARATCRFVPANCYCMCPSPGVKMRVPDKGAQRCGCACGGGPPSMCVERTAAP